MKRTADSQSQSRETSLWPSVLRIPSEEFQQCVAVAQLAIKLCELKVARSRMPIQKGNLDPKDCLADAWKLIESAREHVLRPKTPVEHVVEQGGSREAVRDVLARKLQARRIPFQKLCDPGRKEGDSEAIEGVHWKVYRTERAFENLFRNYSNDIREKWKRGDQEIGTLPELDTKGKARRVNFYPETERARMQTLARNNDTWKKSGESVLASWKRDGLPPEDFLAIARFRRERDKRSANLKTGPKRKRSGKLKAR